MTTLYVAFDDAEDYRILRNVAREFDVDLWQEDILIDDSGASAIMPIEIASSAIESLKERLTFCRFDMVEMD